MASKKKKKKQSETYKGRGKYDPYPACEHDQLSDRMEKTSD